MKPSGYSYVFLFLCALSLSVMVFIVSQLSTMQFGGETPPRGVAMLLKKSKARAHKMKLKAKKGVKKNPRKKDKSSH